MQWVTYEGNASAPYRCDCSGVSRFCSVTWTKEEGPYQVLGSGVRRLSSFSQVSDVKNLNKKILIEKFPKKLMNFSFFLDNSNHLFLQHKKIHL